MSMASSSCAPRCTARGESSTSAPLARTGGVWSATRVGACPSPPHARCAVLCRDRRADSPIIAPAIRLPDGEMASFKDVMFRNRIVFVGERIGDDTVTRLVASLLALEGMDPKKEIKLYINSSGASAYSALAIVDVMRQMTCPISTVAFGQVNSTAALVLAAGTKGRRMVMPNARVMIHQPFGYVAGSSEEVKITATELSRTMRVIHKLYAEFTGRAVEEIEEATDRDYYMGPQEAIDFGIVDAMVRSDKFPENGTPAPFRGKSIKEIARLSNRDAVVGTGLGN